MLAEFCTRKMSNFLENQARNLDWPIQIIRNIKILSMILFFEREYSDDTICVEVVIGYTNWERSDILASLEANKLAWCSSMEVGGSRLVGQKKKKKKDNLLLTEMTVVRVLAFWCYFPKPQFLKCGMKRNKWRTVGWVLE